MLPWKCPSLRVCDGGKVDHPDQPRLPKSLATEGARKGAQDGPTRVYPIPVLPGTPVDPRDQSEDGAPSPDDPPLSPSPSGKAGKPRRAPVPSAGTVP